MKEITDLIIYTIAMFICVIGYNYCYAKLNNHHMKFDLKKIGIIFLTSIILLFNNNFYSIITKAIFNLLCICLELKYFFNDKPKKIIINYIFIYLLMSLTEIICAAILLFFGLIANNSSASSLSYINMCLSLLIVIIEYMIISLKPIKKNFQKLINFFVENKTISNISYLIFVTIAIISMFYIENFTDRHSFQLILLLFIIFAILFISLIRVKFHEEMLKLTNKKLVDYNDNYGKFLDEYKIYKHNINHKLSAMKTYGNKRINALIDDLLQEETTFSIRNNEIYNVPNGIKGIIAEKLYNKNYDILIDNKIKGDPFSKLDPKAFNSISECIGIALDNAVEASEETKSPTIITDLYEDKENIYIKIGNNFCNQIDLEKIGNKYYSTKNRGSGLGLFSIRKNRLVKETITIINDIYYLELQIKKHAIH